MATNTSKSSDTRGATSASSGKAQQSKDNAGKGGTKPVAPTKIPAGDKGNTKSSK